MKDIIIKTLISV
jgi:tubulin polyglutamylase TTLL6/13